MGAFQELLVEAVRSWRRPRKVKGLQNQVLNDDTGLKESRNLDTPLVKWACEPGTRWNGDKRTIPQIGHSDFVDAFARWLKSGEPFPRTSSAALPPPDIAPGRMLSGRPGRASSPP